MIRLRMLSTAALIVGLGTGCGFGVDPFADDIGGAGGDEGDADGGGPADGTTSGGGVDPMDETSVGEGSAEGSEDDGATDDAGETGMAEPQCEPTPTRMVVLGDSIFACFGVGGKQSADCSALQLHSYISDTVGPVSYENLAVNGARTTDVINNQIPAMEVGMPGHVFVLVFIGGNDLAAHIFSSDDAATNAWENTTGPDVANHWENIFAFFENPANFPDGVTVLMNTQYNPFDDCTASPYPTVTPVKNEILGMHNVALTARADARDYVFIADQHAPFLGHGHHFDKPECPGYIAGAENWMNDLIHPDAAGHANIGQVLSNAVDGMYVDCE
ncbi:MAG: SGNH/GDSL hydrolase family protein [Myxococcota bacterium]